jgi:spore germination cell wall hydrolase CwlJ-like protein
LSSSPLSRFAPSLGRAARIRPLTAATLAVMISALAVGTAYVGGASAKTALARGHAQRIAAATDAGFTEEALAAAAGGLDASALAIARRHDPYAVAGAAQRDRQAVLITAQLKAAPRVAKPAENAARASDLDCLTQAAYYEARGEGQAGMRAVAQVVLNRVKHPAYPKSVCGVVFQGSGRRIGCQFSFTCDGSMRDAVNRGAWDRARTVASSALAGQSYAAVGKATHFHTTAVSPQWRNTLVRINQVGDHVFYRIGGRTEVARQASARTHSAAATPSRPDMLRPALPQDEAIFTQALAVTPAPEAATVVQSAAADAPASTAAANAAPIA